MTQEQAERLISALGTIAGHYASIHAHPSENWCEGINLTKREGERCLRDAVADGLCKHHWRYANGKAEQGLEGDELPN